MWQKILSLILVVSSCSEPDKKLVNQIDIKKTEGIILDSDSIFFSNGKLYLAEVVQLRDTANCLMLSDNYSCKVQKLKIITKDKEGKEHVILESDTAIMNELKGLYGGFEGVNLDTSGNELKIVIRHHAHTGGNYEVFDFQETYRIDNGLTLLHERFTFRTKTYESDTSWIMGRKSFEFLSHGIKVYVEEVKESQAKGVITDTTYSFIPTKDQIIYILQPYNEGAYLN